MGYVVAAGIKLKKVKLIIVKEQESVDKRKKIAKLAYSLMFAKMG